MILRALIVTLVTACLSKAATAGDWQLLQTHQQLVVVTTSGWDVNHGQMQTMTRTQQGWKPGPVTSAVTIGKAGMAWGLGLHPEQQGQHKKEGDGRAPAGIFGLTGAFGYEAMEGIAMPYQKMQPGHYCMDVPDSPYYNQIVDADKVGKQAIAGSSEGMRRDLHYGDDLYKKGLFVAHNPDNVAGAGSCIFMHHWRGPDQPTAGCTAMPDQVMSRLYQWLRPAASPVMILLPESVYREKAAEWGLPALGTEDR